MKMARGLGGLVVTLALIGTACGTKQADLPPTPEQLPKQVVVPPATEQGASDADGKQEDPDTPVSSDGQAAKEGDGATDSNGSGATSGATAVAGVSGAAGASAGGGVSGNSGSSAGGGASGSNGSSGGKGSSGSATGASSSGSKGTYGSSYAGQYHLAVTQSFGSTNLFDQTVSFAPQQDLLASMREHLKVETAYGGGFVNSINGIASGYTDKSIFTRKKRDWFYYVNGSVGAVGANEYALRAADDVWWDYHDWSGSGSNAPCIIGAYPHPFTTGFNGAQPGTVIYYGGQHADDAKRLAGALQQAGAANVRTAAYDGGNLLSLSTNAIVLGTWSELKGKSAIQELFSAPTRTGLYASFADGGVTALDFSGDATDLKGQAAILATGTGNGDTTPLWLVIGTEEKALDQAIDTLVGKSVALKGKIGTIIRQGKLFGVPFEE
ncbi:MAG TPA: DUF4430 domain-containing protein [Bacilli bacterium]|nr:DUF4430 domain-containing protein [Bacilli bacterium]